jgi:hypothetical protein
MQSFTVLVLNVPYTLTIPTAGSCCRPCFLNTYRKQTETRICSSGSSTNPSFAPYGQDTMKCIEGQQKKFCMFKHEWTQTRLSPCTNDGSGSDSDWATCVTCLQTERPKKVGENHECELCNKEESGEYFRDGKCQTCGSCSILTPVFTFEKFEWEKITDYTAVLEQWKKVEEEFKWENRWKYQTVDRCLLRMVLVYLAVTLHIGWGLCDCLCPVLVCRGRYGLRGGFFSSFWDRIWAE